ncbi:MAG: hypothetical protein ACYDHY_19445 [Acidiferrobacterales bacterium]
MPNDDYKHQSDSTEVKTMLQHGANPKDIQRAEKLRPGFFAPSHNLDESHPAVKKLTEHHNSLPQTPYPIHSTGKPVHDERD